MIMSLMKLNQQQNMVRVVTFNFAEPPEQVYTLRLLMSSDQAQKHVCGAVDVFYSLSMLL